MCSCNSAIQKPGGGSETASQLITASSGIQSPVTPPAENVVDVTFGIFDGLQEAMKENPILWIVVGGVILKAMK